MNTSEQSVAIVGMSCRLPGADDPDAFWELLREGRSAIVPVDTVAAYRRSATAGLGHAGLLDHIDLFDPSLFGISPNEAMAMDPQQRLALELAWRALEHAGISAQRLGGSRTGVYIGASADEYGEVLDSVGSGAAARHAMPGTSRAVIANRVSYVLDLKGPSMTIDTAQSASLVAIHLACRSLRSGESTTAIAGGVNLIVGAEHTRESLAFGALSPDGHCYAFDARANGYVRGEGGALFVLKLLPQAEADGDTIYGLILGSAVNHDGNGVGLTVPNASAQAQVITAALADAQVAPETVDYVELHGSGAPVGDPIEAEGLHTVFAGARAAGPLLVGSVKTNIGHLEGAAGAAGLLKTVLSLQHGQVVASLNFDRLNTEIARPDASLRVPTRPEMTRGRAIAGVSSFGVGGANAHLVVAGPPEQPAEPAREWVPGTLPLVLSARTRAGLLDTARNLGEHIRQHPELELPDIAWSLAATRPVFEYTAVIFGDSAPAVVAGLDAVLPSDATTPGSPIIGRRAELGPAAFLFSGAGGQWLSSCAELAQDWVVFREHLSRCSDEFAPLLGCALGELVAVGDPASVGGDIERALRFTVQTGVVEVWKSLGVAADSYLADRWSGTAAAFACGALTLADAARSCVASDPRPEGESAPLDLYRPGGTEPRTDYLDSVESGIATLVADCHEVFVEVGLCPLQPRPEGVAVPDTAVIGGSLAGDSSCSQQLLSAVAEFAVRGVDIDWTAVVSRGRRVSLPGYPMQCRSFWPTTPFAETPGAADRCTTESAGPQALPAVRRGDGSALALVLSHAADILGHNGSSELDPGSTFKDLGFDSLSSLELRTRIAAAVGERLPAGLLYDYPTPERLAARLTATGLTGIAGPAPAISVEPIAVVAMACRLPGGADTPEGLWNLVAGRRDVTGEFPTNRGWDLDHLFDPHPVAGTSYARRGGFIYDADEFDAEFFGINPREALAMDPQQRLLLEISWEAAERLGSDPADLRGSRTGVYVGATPQEYAGLSSPGPGAGYLLTGTAPSVASGRIAYSLGLEGPAITVDTACSSSLVALHLAAQALRLGECDLALAGGAAVMAAPGMFLEFSRQQGLAADGRCKPFADAADGTAWAEGAGILVLERLSDAQRKGRNILALLRGSAINQDGASNGLSAPNGPAQQRVIERALADAGLAPADVDAVEAHGTGTTLGDPIEAEALIAAYGPGRDAQSPLLLGSVKSNLGHTQAAAGVVGVIKMILALRHGLLPATLHAEVPSRHVDWSAGTVRLLTEPQPWPHTTRPRRAGISSFGVSGTNAHVIIEEPPQRADAAEPAPDLAPVVSISAKTEAAVRAYAGTLRAHLLAHPEVRVPDVAATLSRRSAFDYSAELVATEPADLVDQLADVATGRAAVRRAERRPLAILFTGQGSQFPAMGRELYRSYPAFAAALDEVCAGFAPHLAKPLREIIFDTGSEDIHRTEYTQPAVFAVETALYRLVTSWGVEPAYLVGHSLGEVTAAHVAGVLSLADACTLVAHRARLMASVDADGAMTAIAAAPDLVAQSLEPYAGAVTLAAVNGPESVVISGDAVAVDAVAAHWKSTGHRTKRLPISCASHSPHMTPILAEFVESIRNLTYRDPVIPVLSNVTGAIATVTQLCAPEYWAEHIRSPVRFADGVTSLLRLGVGAFLELGPGGVLTAMADACVPPNQESSVVLAAALLQDRPEAITVNAAVAAISVTQGRRAVREPGSGGHIDLPTYAFQRQRFWLDRRESPDIPSAVSEAVYRMGWSPLPDLEPRSPQPQARFTQWTDIQAMDTVPDAVFVAAMAVPPAADPDTVRQLTTGILATLQGWLADDRYRDATLVVVTERAVSVTAAEPVADAAGAAVRALVRTALNEHPGRFVLVDIDDDARSREVLVRTAFLGHGELAVRAGRLFTARLERAEPRALRRSPDWSHGTVLVTGASGGLAREVLPHLVSARGARQLLLVSRTRPHPEFLTELARAGATVQWESCDLSDRAALEAILAQVSSGRPLVAVLHLAGVVDDAVFEAQTGGHLDRVFGAKVDAVWHLHTLTASQPLTDFVVFSSVAATFGTGGQANYAAANGYLDGFMSVRRAAGLPGISVAWGIWDNFASVMADSLTDLDRTRWWQHWCLGPIRPRAGVELLDRCLALDESVLLPLGLDTAARNTPVPAVLRGLVREIEGLPGANPNPGAASAVQPTEYPTKDAMTTLVAAEVAAVLGHRDAVGLSHTAPLKELGFDSLTAVDLRNRLSGATGCRLASTLVFDYPSIRALTEYLYGLQHGVQRPRSAPTGPVPVDDDDPVVIVAMSGRYPGGDSVEELWRLISDGRESLSEFPVDRGWDLSALIDDDADAPGTCYARRGGFIRTATEFDNDLFGISPREAVAMDPQQRVLLETAWELFERAGLDPEALRGSRTGVFVGSTMSGYGAEATDIDGYISTGTHLSVVSGRLAYVFGLEGPALTIDTACSSSLVAIHTAVRALRAGECDRAVAGGVTIMATPAAFIDFSRQRGLAPDGRIKAFANAADGTAFAEGAGLLLLERLSAARRAGHRVLAVVRGSAVNSDGASNGLTAPSGPSQQRVIEAALVEAGLTPDDVDAVEAHGTGTTLGDPIEAAALIATYGRDRDVARPLWLGSMKSNIGHSQAAAGVAGVIKMVSAMWHEYLPPTLHVDEPSTHVDWSADTVRLLTEGRPWPSTGRPRRAGISSFGISGTNAHLILEQAPAVEPDPISAVAEAEPAFVVLSGQSERAVRAAAAGLRSRLLVDPDIAVADVAATLAQRAQLEYRAVVAAGDHDELTARLAEIAGGAQAVTRTVDGPLVMSFPGQGSQYPGMGRELYATYPVFAAALDEVCAEFGPHLANPLPEVLFGAEDDARVHDTEYTQPALFAVEVALYRLFMSWGVVPAYLIGHSLGEITAAHVAGVLSLSDACTLVATRARLMGSVSRAGAMAAIGVNAVELEASIAALGGAVGLAAVNGPCAVVVSGDTDAVEQVMSYWRTRGRRVKRLEVSHAFHSAHMDSICPEFAAAIADLRFHRPAVPIVSNVTGAVASAEQLTSPEYWSAHIRKPVRFYEGVTALCELGAGAFLELGPGGVLTTATSACLPTGDERGITLTATMFRGRSEVPSVAAAAVTVVPDWRRLEVVASSRCARRITLPTYVFDRKRYWLDAPSNRAAAAPRAVVSDPGVDWVSRVRLLDRDAALRELTRMTAEAVAEVLGYESVHDVPQDRALADLGFDSMGALKVRNRLNTETGLPLPASIVMDYLSIPEVSARLATELESIAAENPDSEPADVALQVRRLLDRIPAADLRNSGVLDTLERLASGDSATVVA